MSALREEIIVLVFAPCVFTESQWREKKNDGGIWAAETDGISQKHIETLDHICRTHLR